jgi:predicted N-acetyltransferase YhbS
MQVTVRHYDRAADYDRVGRFLVRTYRTAGEHINWLQPRWEYMHFHPLIRGVDLTTIGIWEANGEIVGAVHPEDPSGLVFFEIDPEYGALKDEMLTYAEENLSARVDGERQLRVLFNDADDDFHRTASARGYAKGEGGEPTSTFAIPSPFPAIVLPPSFRLLSLADDNDLGKVNRVLWRGFNHGDEPPDDGLQERQFMQSAPNYRKDLNIVVAAPDGKFVSYCGMWYEPVHRIAMVEPVATDPDYRRLGLGSAAVLEGIRRCGELGATVAYVGSTLPIYLSVGFRLLYRCSVWQREWTGCGIAAG